MLKKDGLPEENEIVLCTVSKIQHHSVFCNLDEYGKTGMLHISEISSGRIRNITEYVTEGKTIVCKVLKLDKERGYIDLSLRRVTEAQKKAKAAGIKKHQVADKIVQLAATELKVKAEDLWEEINANLGNYENAFDLFQATVEGQATLNLKKPTVDVVQKLVNEKLKPAQVHIKGILEIVTYDSNGLALIHNAFKDTGLDASYMGGGKYAIGVTAKDYKKAESLLKVELDKIMKPLEKKTAKLQFERTDR